GICTCSIDAHCKSGFYCDTASSRCVQKKSNGAGCSGSNQCSSNDCSPRSFFCCPKTGTCGPVAGNLVQNGSFDSGFMFWNNSGASLSNNDAGGCANSQSASGSGTLSQCINLTSATKTTWTISLAARMNTFLCEIQWYADPN